MEFLIIEAHYLPRSQPGRLGLEGSNRSDGRPRTSYHQHSRQSKWCCHVWGAQSGNEAIRPIHDLSRENGASYIRQLSARFEGLAFLGVKKIFWAFETKETPTVMASQKP